MQLEGKVAIVTGAGGGIGAATAKTFAQAGARVVVADISAEAADKTANDIVGDGGEAEVFQGDLARTDVVEQMVGAAVRRFGRLDVLHNNAIALTWGRVGDLDLDGWHRTLDVGLTSYWYATKMALQHMVPQGSGVVLNTASVSGLAADFGIAAYNVVKAGVLNLTRVTGIEYARKGIRCNAICPGPIGTPVMLAAERAKPGLLGTVKDAIPMGRFGEPQEIANVALFLASDEASFITGAFFVADGGLSAHTNLPSFGNASW